MVTLLEDVDELKGKMANSFIHSNTMVLDCYTEWCKPCKKLYPIYEEVAKEVEDVSFYKADMSESEDIGNHFDVRKLPTIIIIKKGEVVESTSGFKEKEEILELINKHK